MLRAVHKISRRRPEELPYLSHPQDWRIGPIHTVRRFDAHARLIYELSAKIGRVNQYTDPNRASAEIDSIRLLVLGTPNCHAGCDNRSDGVQVAVRHQHVTRGTLDIDLLPSNQPGDGRGGGTCRREANCLLSEREERLFAGDRPKKINSHREWQQRDRQVDKSRVHLFQAYGHSVDSRKAQWMIANDAPDKQHPGRPSGSAFTSMTRTSPNITVAFRRACSRAIAFEMC
jgi:hypothetical protein